MITEPPSWARIGPKVAAPGSSLHHGLVVFDLQDLTVPIIRAPMAGGQHSALAARCPMPVVWDFWPQDTWTGQRFADDIVAARLLTSSGSISVNLFVPQAICGNLVRLSTNIATG